jgi:Stage II sporulation protein E (SpoIIE)
MVRFSQMRPKYPQLLAAALFVFLSESLFSAPRPQPAPPPPPPSLAITLGDSAIPLTGPWKFSPGDSPWTTNLASGVPIWTRAAFDDSAWATIDLTPAADSSGGLLNTPGWLPGWTRRGYSQLTGFAWYRLRLHITNPSQALALKMPGSFEDAYEVYANGQLVGSFGNFTATDLTPYYAQPASFALPQVPPDGQLEIALRVYMTPSTPYRVPDAGGLHGPPIIGLASTIQVLQDADKNFYFHSYFGDFLLALLALLVLPLAFWALSGNLNERMWLWLTLALAIQAIEVLVVIASHLTTAISAASADLWADSILGPAGLCLWVLFWWSWFQLSRIRWIAIASAVVAAAHICARIAAVSPSLGLNLVDPSHLQLFSIASVLAVTAQAALLIVILNEGFHRLEAEAVFAAAPILLLIVANYARYLAVWFNLSSLFRVSGLGISATSLERMLMIAAIAALAARRFLESSVTKDLAHRIFEQDRELARALQERVLAPEELHSTNFDVEAEYHAAQTVGGDFFVTIVGRDGSLCIVIGDVSGKGISAAMLVAVLVGAARTRAAQDFDPITMLQTLDERLSGRSDGNFATCVAAQLFPNGVLRLANAGHIPPYLNGCELDLEGSLPLGIAGKLNPAKKQFQLRQGDILTFITDGVIEAKNKEGELLGFEQARVLSQKSPAAILSEVQAYGQDDDVTAIRVSFVRSDPVGPSTNNSSRQPVHA